MRRSLKQIVGVRFVEAFLLLTAIGLMAGCDNTASQGATAQREIERELKALKAMTGASGCRHQVSHKNHSALVERVCSTKLSYQEIRAFYDAELGLHGWQFQGEEKLQDWRRDLGGKVAHYCKGPYNASLQYAGEQADYGWDYALSLSWEAGQSECGNSAQKRGGQ